MPPILHCVRHAQGFHNLNGGTYHLPDPHLTPLGVEQCEKLRQTSFQDQSNIALVMASPMLRTLSSAYVVFGPALTSGGICVPLILAVPDGQETSDDACDIGSDPDTLRDIIKEKNWPVDLSLVKDGWNNKALDSPYSPGSNAIFARARDLRILIRQKMRELAANGNHDIHVALVTHGSYLHFLTNDWENAHWPSGTGWTNCETRSYTFEHDFESNTDPDAMLIETMESREQRGKDRTMFGPQMQKELFKRSMHAWGDMGLQRPDRLNDIGTAQTSTA